jgi:hypothetical protein
MERRTVLLVCGALLVAALATVNYGLASTAEDRVERRVSNAIGSPADVDLGGWPVGLRLALGRIPRIDVLARDVSLGQGDARLPYVRAELEEVALGIGGGHIPGPGLPDFASGRFQTDLEPDTLAAYLAARHAVDDVAVRAERVRVLVNGEAHDASPDVHGGVAVLRTANGDLELELDEALPGDAEVERARIVDGRLRLVGSLARH